MSGGTTCTKSKPKRTCIFCYQYKADLRRHILEVHSEEERIKTLLEKKENGEITQKEILQEIDQMRKEGISYENSKILLRGGDDNDLQCERKCTGTKVKCSK